MTIRSLTTMLGAVALIGGIGVAIDVRAGADQVAFPENWAKGVVYMTIDRPNNKQLTEYYVSQAAIDAAKKGTPLPSGTTITAVGFAAKLDEQGNPVKDAGGKFIKTGNPTADLNGCFGCHKPQDKLDFVFTYDKLKLAAQ